MTQIPIRLRITLIFAVVMAGVLGITGIVIHDRFSNALDRAIGNDLESRAQEVQLLAADGLLPEEIEPTFEVPFASVLEVPPGVVVDSIPLDAVGPSGRIDDELRVAPDLPLPDGPTSGALIPTPTDGSAWSQEDFSVFEATAAGLPSSVTLVQVGDSPTEYVALGIPLAERDASLGELRSLLWVALPLALVLSSLAAWWVASAALRPVEAMRRRAAEIPTSVGGQRLPLTGGRDELQRLGGTINDMLTRIEGGVTRERALIADTSHEIRTPLAALDAQLQLARRPGRPPEQVVEAVEKASAESRRLTGLAEGLLLLAGADADGLTVRPEPTDSEPWIDSAVERCCAGGDPDIEVRVDVGGAPEIFLDPELAGLALGNLIDNALRYAEASVRISVALLPEGARLTVSDDGPGFPDDFLSRAFERFSRPSNMARGKGSGLGLAIAKSVVEAHGGTITADNEGGGGRVAAFFPEATD